MLKTFYAQDILTQLLMEEEFLAGVRDKIAKPTIDLLHARCAKVDERMDKLADQVTSHMQRCLDVVERFSSERDTEKIPKKTKKT